jgi:CRP-like cAMP-binding protein
MRVSEKVLIDKNLLRELVPLNAIPAERFREISKNIIIEEVLKGKYLFRKGDNDNHSIYLIEGKINLIDGTDKVTGEIKSGTDESRYAIASQRPREFSARAVKKCVIARINSGLLDMLLTSDESGGTEVVEIGADDNTDWMTRLLQTKAFKNIPPAMLQSLLIKMQPYPVEAGQVIVQQGDPGDYFYTIREGRCLVTRKDSSDSGEQHLAELDSGASFGEDALVSDSERNATVTMLTAGLLMRLSSKDFLDLLKNQLVKHVEYEQALAMVDEDAVWVDVRTKDEYESGSFEDSVNLPLSDLRDEIAELVFNTKYIVCCDTGKRSELAGFLLSHKGFEVYVLEGGIPGSLLDAAILDSQTYDEPTTHDVVSIEACNRSESRSDELALLRAENEKLSMEIMRYQANEVRMRDQIKQQRDELCELGEKLESLHDQINSKK